MNIRSLLRRIRPLLFPKNSWQEHLARHLFAFYSSWLATWRSYRRWQSIPQAQNNLHQEIRFLSWQEQPAPAEFDRQVNETLPEWLLIASAPLQPDPSALSEIKRAIAEYPQAELIYSDGDWLDPRNRRVNPWFKPAFGLDSLRAQNYITPFFAVRKTLGDSIGWLNPAAGSAGAEDLIWRVVEQARQVVHIPKVLYHQTGDRPVSFQDEQRALKAHLEQMPRQILIERLNGANL